ncbi:MAG TPA: hypothetical protein DHW39_05430 [Erysipelotrichaceae bacterium]|nr:hypothetical protein [Erysipelotrichaceae bacterium]
MEQTLREICEDFLYYRDVIRAERIFGSYRQLYPVCSYIYLIKHQEPNEEMIALCKSILRENTSFISYFRGNGEEVFITMLATDDDPGRRMKLALAAYDFLKDYFASSSFLPFLALTMARLVRPDAFADFSLRAKQIYDMMHDSHLWLTGQEDVAFSGLLALDSTRSNDELLEEMEYCFDRCSKGMTFHHNAVQSVSHALTLCAGDRRTKCDNLKLFLEALELSGIQIPKGYEQVSLAILPNLGIPLDTLVADFCAVDDFLAVKDGYGFFGFSKRTRYMHDAMILSAYYLSESVELTTAVIISVLLEIQSEQAAAAAAAA